MNPSSSSLQSIIDCHPRYWGHGLFDHRSTIVLCRFAPIVLMLSMIMAYIDVSCIHCIYRIKDAYHGIWKWYLLLFTCIHLRNWVNDLPYYTHSPFCPCSHYSLPLSPMSPFEYMKLSNRERPAFLCLPILGICKGKAKGERWNQVGPSSSFFRISREVTTKWKWSMGVPSSPICWQHDYTSRAKEWRTTSKGVGLLFLKMAFINNSRCRGIIVHAKKKKGETIYIERWNVIIKG